MKRIKQVFICIALSLLMLISCLPLYWLASNNEKSAMPSGTPLAISDPTAYTAVAQNGKFSLSYCADNGAVRVVSGGAVWDSAVTEEVFDTSLSTDTFKAYMNSLLAINYCKKNDNSGNYIKDYSSLAANRRTAYSITDGVAVKCEFTAPKISMTVKIVLTDSGLKVSIPQDGISEKGDYMLYSAEVLPFFGAAAQNDSGYLFYPDGSGAVTEFATSMEKSRFTDELVLDVYSTLDDDQMLSEEARKVMLPVYGIKRNATAMLACADMGEENVSIHVSPCIPMSLLSVNRSYFEFKYRGQYKVYISNSVRANQETEELQYKFKLDSSMIKGDREISIFLLEGADADYSGMANAYRDHLLDNGSLKKERAEQGQTLSLDLYTAVSDPTTFFESNVVATDFKQVGDIIEDYLSRDVKALNVRLVGWSDDGGNLPQQVKAAGELGGNKGLKGLNTLAGEYGDRLTLTLKTEPILTSKKRLAAVMGNLIPMTDTDKETFLLTPEKAVTGLNKFVKYSNKYSNIGLSVQSIGQTVYGDYKKSRKLNRADTVAKWEQGIENNAVYSVQGGNLYALKNVDYLYDIPVSSSGYPLTDYSVPFYQMVVHGHTAYSAQCPANLSPDIKAESLKWMEYGCVPYFVLTAENSNVFSETAANTVFSSENGEWKQTVIETYNTFEKVFSSLADKHIIRHERITDTLVAVSYEDNTQIIINHGDTAAEYNGATVEPKSYCVKGDGEE